MNQNDARKMSPKLDSCVHLTVATAVVRSLVDAVEDLGVSGAVFLRAGGIDPQSLGTADARVSGTTVYTLCNLAMELTQEPAFAFRWATHLHGGALGPVSLLIANAPTLRQGIASYTRFLPLLSDHACHELTERDDTATLRCRGLPRSPRMQRFASEIIMAFFFRVLRGFDRHVQPLRVSFGYPAPAYGSDYTRAFQQPACFDQPFTGIVFDRALLDRPARHQDDGVHEVLRGLAEQRLQRITQQRPYTARVRDLLMRGGTPHRADMPTVARALGISVRSLHRRLAAEGKSYNEVANEALSLVAKQLLRDSARSIQEAAFDMGFSDARSFHRAFKRWTGMTPRDYRYQGSSPKRAANDG
jgi:AraC-like DNA-binding protein